MAEEINTKPKLYLNLGCGNSLMQGHVNVDMAAPRYQVEVVARDKFWQSWNVGDLADPGSDLSRVLEINGIFVESQVQDLSWLPDECVDAIVANCILEHFHPSVAAQILWEWRLRLKPGGTLSLMVPDFCFHAGRVIATMDADVHSDADHLETLAWTAYEVLASTLDTSPIGTQYKGHLSAWTERSLKYVLESEGFVDVQIGRAERDERWLLALCKKRETDRLSNLNLRP